MCVDEIDESEDENNEVFVEVTVTLINIPCVLYISGLDTSSLSGLLF